MTSKLRKHFHSFPSSVYMFDNNRDKHHPLDNWSLTSSAQRERVFKSTQRRTHVINSTNVQMELWPWRLVAMVCCLMRERAMVGLPITIAPIIGKQSVERDQQMTHQFQLQDVNISLESSQVERVVLHHTQNVAMVSQRRY